MDNNNSYDPNEKYFDKPSIWQRICHRVRTKKGYKIVAEVLAFFMLMAVIYIWYILGAAYFDML